MKFCSIIMTHYAKDDERSEVMKESINSLIESLDYPSEITVVDNGNNSTDSTYLLMLVQQGKINTYVRNSNNMHFGYARNQGLCLSHGDYICIVDNDLMYEKGWLSDCIKILEKYPQQKIYATPMPYPRTARYVIGKLDMEGREYILDTRAGSNCFVVRKDDMNEIGWFMPHRIAGTKWTDTATKKGYSAAVVPGNPVKDVGIRNGYDFKEVLPIKLHLSDGHKIIFNNDLTSDDKIAFYSNEDYEPYYTLTK